MLKIGMLMTRNEADVISEVMTEYSKYFDTFFCLDNSTDNTLDIIKTFPKVEYAKSEKELYLDSSIMKDGIRSILLAAIQDKYGYDENIWIFCLNGDEIFFGNPDLLLTKKGIENCNLLNAIIANFVLHESEKETEYDNSKSITTQRLWYFLSQPENIAFRNQKGLYYISGEHMRVVPHGYTNGHIAFDKFIIRGHYNMRNEQQLKDRIQDRVNRGWQYTYRELQNNIYVNNIDQVITAGKKYSDLQKFDGEFKFLPEYEYLKNQLI